MNIFWALVPRKGSTAIFDKGLVGQRNDGEGKRQEGTERLSSLDQTLRPTETPFSPKLLGGCVCTGQSRLAADSNTNIPLFL